jgi:two-component system, sensor histidine kinase
MLHVLLVEDNPLVAEVTQSRLNKIFANVTLARNGEDALTMAQ